MVGDNLGDAGLSGDAHLKLARVSHVQEEETGNLSASCAERSSKTNNGATAAETSDSQVSTVRPVKAGEPGDDNVPAIRLRIPASVQSAMISFSIFLHGRPDLQDRVLLRVACIL